MTPRKFQDRHAFLSYHDKKKIIKTLGLIPEHLATEGHFTPEDYKVQEGLFGECLTEFVEGLFPDGILQPLSAFETLKDTGWQEMENLGQPGWYDIDTKRFCDHVHIPMPEVIRRCMFTNPAWYTAYTPYQAEISQGRLELLFYFQSMVSNLTGLPVANASLLDSASAAAEAMSLAYRIGKKKRKKFLVSHSLDPSAIRVISRRAWDLGVDCKFVSFFDFPHISEGDDYSDVFGLIFSYECLSNLGLKSIEQIQQFLGALKKKGVVPIVLQDILSLVAYESPGELGATIAVGTTQPFGLPPGGGGPHAAFIATEEKHTRLLPGRIVGLSKDRSGRPAYRLALQTREQHIRRDKATSNICTAQAFPAMLATAFAMYHGPEGLRELADQYLNLTMNFLERKTSVLPMDAFNCYTSESSFTRYLYKLSRKDITLVDSMIPLGSCTMKLNPAEAMAELDHPILSAMRYVDLESDTYTAKVMKEYLDQIGDYLASLLGLSHFDLSPNSGAQGEYAGLVYIKNTINHKKEKRDVVLIPTSAHGTNPASAQMVGFRTVGVKCLKNGNIDIEDLKQKAEKYKDALAALMITYPSTHGILEPGIRTITKTIHDCGGYVYMDGANMNAMAAMVKPGQLGVDVMHLNLHKTFCIPHGGGGPGMGPIFMSDRIRKIQSGSSVTQSQYGSALILLITRKYIELMDTSGIRHATEQAILKANYMAKRLVGHYDILYTDENGHVAHEFILDVRNFGSVTGEDIAKRLIDFGFHAPTMSWPVNGTLMIEPTESEDLGEIDRYIEALIKIREEIEDNPDLVKGAPYSVHDLGTVTNMEAFFPLPWVQENKYWPPVSRVNNSYGDRNLVCTCDAHLDTE